MLPADPQQIQQQWLSACLALRKDLRFDKRFLAGEHQIVVEDVVRGKFFQIGLAEYQFLSKMDGQRTVKELIDDFLFSDISDSVETHPLEAHSLETDSIDSSLPSTENGANYGSGGGRETPRKKILFEPSQAVQVAQWLIQNNLAYLPSADNTKRIEEQAKQLNRAKLMGILNPLSFKIRLFNPNQILRQMQFIATALFSRWFFVAWLLVGGFAATILFSHWKEIGVSTLQVFSGYRWLWLIVAWIGLKIVHELAHGLACRRFGGEVPEAGVLFILFTPMAYVNVTSMWRFANRWERILVSLAGIYLELALSFLALIVWHYFPGVWGDLAFNVFIMASLNTILFNANPLMRFDGYFVLSDLLQVPNLYAKSFRWLGDRAKHLYLGTPLSNLNSKKNERLVVPLYGISAWCWKITVTLSLLIGASVLFRGAGMALAILGFVLWVALPLWKQWNWFVMARRNKLVRMPRLVLSVSCTMLLLFGLFVFLRAPATKSAPAMVQFADEHVLRAASSGFVKKILVQDGQRVTRGQPLLIIQNQDLELEIYDLKQRIIGTSIQARIKSNSKEIAQAQAESEKLNSLQKQLTEKQAQLDALCVKAPDDGVIFRRDLKQQLGRHLRVGDELVSFVKDGNKQVVASIDQRDWESIQFHGNTPMRVLFPGHTVMCTPVHRIHPRASLIPPHSTMTATEGGPLSVKPKAPSQKNDPHSSSAVELLTPRFSVELSLSPDQSTALAAGQRGYAFFESSRQSMGSYLYLAVADWFRRKLEMAQQPEYQ